MNRICNTCNINTVLKDRSVCKSCYNINRRKNNKIDITPQQTKIEKVNIKDNNTHENHAYIVIGPRNIGKTYYMLTLLEKLGNKRPIHIITRSANQYPNYKTSNEIKSIDKCKGSVVIFDDMLGARNSFQKDEFFTRGKREKLDVYYISQSYFGLPRH